MRAAFDIRRAFLMALAVLIVVAAATLGGLHYIITVQQGSPFILVPVAVSFPFVLRAIIRGWLPHPAPRPAHRPRAVGSGTGRSGINRAGGTRRLITAIWPQRTGLCLICRHGPKTPDTHSGADAHAHDVGQECARAPSFERERGLHRRRGRRPAQIRTCRPTRPTSQRRRS